MKYCQDFSRVGGQRLGNDCVNHWDSCFIRKYNDANPVQHRWDRSSQVNQDEANSLLSY